MNFVDQEFPTRTEAMSGDCVRACVATVMGLQRESVPHFVQLRGDEWRAELGAWLRGQGMYALEVTYTSDHWLIDGGLEAPCLALGDGPRGARHAVVWSTDESLVHDPHPSRKGLCGDPRSLLFLIERPSRCATESEAEAEVAGMSAPAGLTPRRNCGENGDNKSIEHRAGECRVECDCGVCGPWQPTPDEANQEWDRLNR